MVAAAIVKPVSIKQTTGALAGEGRKSSKNSRKRSRNDYYANSPSQTPPRKALRSPQSRTTPPFSSERELASAQLGCNTHQEATVPKTTMVGGATSSDPGYVHSLYLSSTTELEPAILSYLVSEESPEVNASNLRAEKVAEEAFLLTSYDKSSHFGHDRSVFMEIAIAIRPHVEILLDTFFAKIWPILPILDESTSREAARTGTLDPALLLCIYLIIQRWAPESPVPSYDVNKQLLEHDVWRHLETTFEQPRLSIVQAGLLLLQCSAKPSHLRCTQLVSLAYDLGLHVDCAAWRISNLQKSLRRSLAWMLYVHEKWSSLTSGRPSCITDANWTLSRPDQGDFGHIDNSRPLDYGITTKSTTASDVLSHVVTLTTLLSEVLDGFHTSKACAEIFAAGHDRLRFVLQKAKPIQIKLKSWFSGLPEHLKLDSNDRERTDDHVGLHLAYFATEIALHRCIIRFASGSDSDPQLMHICRSAAKTRLVSAMDFVNRLRPSHLEGFWPFAAVCKFAVIGTFGALLEATAPTEEETSFYRMRLEEYHWTLQVSCRKAAFLQNAIDALDVNLELLDRLPSRPNTGEFEPRRYVKSDTGLASPSTSTDSNIGDGMEDL